MDSEVEKRPVAECRTPFGPGGGADFGAAGVVGDTIEAPDVTSRREAASESLSSVMSLSQSDLPVDITIWEARQIFWGPDSSEVADDVLVYGTASQSPAYLCPSRRRTAVDMLHGLCDA